MPETTRLARFERIALPHLGAAFNLARWLTRNNHDAEDVVQEAYLRALRFFDSFQGEDGRAWLLTIVRHTCYSWLRCHRRGEGLVPFDENTCTAADTHDNPYLYSPPEGNPEILLLQQARHAHLNQALETLPLGYREVLILRELEELPYKDIAQIVNIPLGTVMSRLARARQLLQLALTKQSDTEAKKWTATKR